MRSIIHFRSLVTTLRAAEKFDVSHLSSPAVAPLVEGAKVFYVEGFFLTHGVASVLALSKHATEKNKVRSLVPPIAITLSLTTVTLAPVAPSRVLPTDIRHQPLRAVHPPVLQRPARAGPPLHRHRHRERI